MRTLNPSRYTDPRARATYRLINRYVVGPRWVRLELVVVSTGRMRTAVLLDKGALHRTMAHHWTCSSSRRPPCASVGARTVTIGRFISGSTQRICGRMGSAEELDLRRGRYVGTGNAFRKLHGGNIEMTISRRRSLPYRVLLDGEDLPIAQRHTWRVEKDRTGTYTPMTRVDGRVVFMHRYLLQAHGEPLTGKHFRQVHAVQRRFDLRKAMLRGRHMVNHYRRLNPRVCELTINSMHGPVRVLLDASDYGRVSSVGWVYKRNGKGWVIISARHQGLKGFILGRSTGERLLVHTRRDARGRLDFRKASLRKGLISSYARGLRDG
jgi:hypothetical protein